MAGFFTINQIGPNRGLTPEGFLVCRNVPVARTGLQLYGPGETPIQITNSGVVRVEREEDEVFDSDCLESLQGKPIVDDHPETDEGLRLDVTPANWTELAVGTVIDPRRGEGELDQFVVVDLIIYLDDAIDAINAGKRELSVGYEADYDEIEPGHGRQYNIRANHIALVERGRCGPRCAIGDAMLELVEQITMDHDPFCNCAECTEEEEDMPTVQPPARTGTSLRDRIVAAFTLRDRKALDQVLADPAAAGLGRDEGESEGEGKENGNGEHHVHVHIPPGVAAAPPNGADQGGGDPGELFRQAVTGVHSEMDEIWDAIGSMAGGTAPRDAYPHRDKRRGRDQKEDKDDDNGEEKTGDELGPAPGNGGNKTILSGFEIEAPPGTKLNDARKARDSALMEDSFADTIALGEVLAPGVTLPTFDKAATPKRTFDALCGFRAKVFDLAYHDPETREIVEAVTGGRFAGASAKVPCDRLRDWFFAAGAMKMQRNALGNNAKGGRFADAFDREAAGPIRTTQEWQQTLDKHYAERRPPAH